jgi:hypothetical protein
VHTAGPLVVCAENPRYFAVEHDAEPRAVLLTGSHVWNNVHDGLGPDPDGCGEEASSFDMAAAGSSVGWQKGIGGVAS